MHPDFLYFPENRRKTPKLMKTRNLLILLVTLFLSTSLSAQSTWQFAYGATGSDIGAELAEVSPGKFAIGGNTESFSANTSQGMVMMIDDAGAIQWAKHSGGSANEYGGGLKAYNGEIYSAGYTDEFGPATINGYLQKYDANGNLQYSIASGIAQIEEFTHVDIGPNGEVYAVGFSFQGGIDAYVVKFNTNGTVAWSKTVGNPSTAELSFNGTATSDGGFMVFGATSQGAGSDDMFFVKLDASGNVQWSKVYGTNSQDSARDLIQTSDGYVVVGSSNFTGNSEVITFKMDTTGNIVWSNYHATPTGDVAFGLVEYGTGYLIVGQTDNFGQGNASAFMAMLDATGNPQWARAYGGTDDHSLNEVIIPSTGGIMAAGTTDSYGAGSDEIYVIRTDSTGAIGCDDTTFTFPPVNTLMLVSTPPVAMISVTSGSTVPKAWLASNATFSTDTICPPPPCMLVASPTVSDSLVCLGDTLVATNASMGSTSQSWLANGMVIGTGSTLSETQSTPGTYTYQLAVLDSTTGCVDTTDFNFEVLPQPTLNLSATSQCYGDTLVLTNTTPNSVSAIWIIDNIQVGSGQSINLVTLVAGTFGVEMLSDPGSCPATSSFTVFPEVIAAYSFTNTGLVYNFSDQSTNGNTYQWDLGDGTTSTDQNPNHTYATPGNYTVCLTVTSADGCEDSTCQALQVMVGVEEGLEAGIKVSPMPFGEQLKVEIPEGLEISRLTLMDIKGLRLAEWEIEPGTYTDQVLELSSIPSGMYFLTFEGERILYRVKAVKM